MVTEKFKNIILFILLELFYSYGDSGSPLQFKTEYEVFPDDFNTTYLSKIYVSSTVLGIVSFGIGCGHKVPSVYTKLYYFRDWMRDVIENN